MNNKPVAWMHKVNKDWITRILEDFKDDWIPLYTHPAKPIDKPDECINGCPKNQTCDYCAGIKTLKDEEIKQIWYDLYPLSSSSYWDDKREGLAELKFARAILRKAQGDV